MIADLLDVAARVLDRAGELPPLTVTCSPAERFLAPLALTPATLSMSRDDQAALVRAVAVAMGWPLDRLADVDGGWSSAGTLDGVKVQVLAAPMPDGFGTPPPRSANATTADHAALLRALADWSATLPDSVKALEIREDVDNNGDLAARLVLTAGADPALIKELIMSVAADDWSGFRGFGVLPTGHALTVSVGP
jgi:hypothetical protein